MPSTIFLAKSGNSKHFSFFPKKKSKNQIFDVVFQWRSSSYYDFKQFGFVPFTQILNWSICGQLFLGQYVDSYFWVIIHFHDGWVGYNPFPWASRSYSFEACWQNLPLDGKILIWMTKGTRQKKTGNSLVFDQRGGTPPPFSEVWSISRFFLWNFLLL